MGHRVLIVDDSPTMRRIIMRGLNQAGIQVSEFTEAGDGVEGLAALEENQVDLILSDINMPNMNGLDFVKAIGDSHDAPPPIVMVSSECSEDVVQEAMTRGAQGFLKKPFTAEKVMEVLKPFLD
ncbi:MAG: response regulator [Planctomycetota bacterium]|jgi:two-component system chemotaxis response regulator CheY